jgi:hypothetical protein
MKTMLLESKVKMNRRPIFDGVLHLWRSEKKKMNRRRRRRGRRRR